MPRIAVIPQKIIKLLESNHLLSVSQILNFLELKGEEFNKTSVYRALDKLLADGQVCKQTFGEQEAKYELRSDHHDHAVCTNCEKVIMVECHTHEKKQVPGFKIDHHHTTLYGLCSSCNK